MGASPRRLLGLLLASTLVACTTFDDAIVREDETVGSSPSGTPGDDEGEPTDGAEPGEEGPGATPTPTPAPKAKFTGVPVPEGCIADVSPGDRVYTCEGLTVDATIPPLTEACPAAGCGIIVELHGDTGSGPLIDAHLRLRQRAAPRGYIVLAPTGPAIGVIGRVPYPGSSWQPAQDAKIVAITKLFAKVFLANPKRIHVTGFSRGGLATWRLACDHSEFFASVAPGAAGNASTFFTVNQIEPTCFTPGRAPKRPISILTLMGKTDVPIPYPSIAAIKNAALASYALPPGSTLKSDAKFSHIRATKPGGPTVEWFDHGYETLPTGPVGSAKGHCIPGSTYDPNARQYAYACNPAIPTGFDWGAAVLEFFENNPLP
jgi:dienelactone hydrolase